MYKCFFSFFMNRNLGFFMIFCFDIFHNKVFLRFVFLLRLLFFLKLLLGRRGFCNLLARIRYQILSCLALGLWSVHKLIRSIQGGFRSLSRHRKFFGFKSFYCEAHLLVFPIKFYIHLNLKSLGFSLNFTNLW